MKNVLRCTVIYAFVFIVSTISVRAGEIIEVTCSTKSGEEFMVDFAISGGKQIIHGKEVHVTFTKNKIIAKGEDESAYFNLKDGKMYINGELRKGVICKYTNLAALDKEQSPSAPGNDRTKNSLSGIGQDEINKNLKSLKLQMDRIEHQGDVMKILRSMKLQLDRMERRLPN